VNEKIWHIEDHGVVILSGIDVPINISVVVIIDESMLVEDLNPKFRDIGVAQNIFPGKNGIL
jgi:hypothetical protein